MTKSFNHWLDNKDDYSDVKKVIIYDGRSLYLFYHKGNFRRIMVGITESKLFDAVILMLISLNSLCLILYDYHDRDSRQPYN